MAEIDFDELDKEVKAESKLKIAKKAEEPQEKKFFSTEGWTKGPWIAFGIAAVVLIAAAVIFAYVI